MVKKNKKQFNSLSKPIVILGGIILLIIIFLGWNYMKKDHKSMNILSAKPTANQNASYGESKAKHYDQSDIFYAPSQLLIADLIPTDESSLTRISCSPSYNFSGGKYDTAYVDSKEQNLSTEITSYANAIKNESTKEVRDLTACTDNDKTIVSYSQGCGGGCSSGNIAVFQDNILQKTFNIPNSIKMPYFGCSILQLTNDNNLYLRCGGGDGVGAGSLLNKVNLDTNTVTPIKSCVSQGTTTQCN